jgi:hypothetical protein
MTHNETAATNRGNHSSMMQQSNEVSGQALDQVTFNHNTSLKNDQIFIRDISSQNPDQFVD